MYRYTESGEILRESDGACIPCDPSNRHYRKLMDEGITIAPFAADVSPLEGLALAEHDEWLIETAALRALSRIELDQATDQALAQDDDHLFSDTDDISEKQALEAALAQKDEELAFANERIAELESREPEVRIVERVVEVSSPEAAPLKIIPDEIAAMMDPGDTFSPEVRRKLTERLNVELAELKNLRGLAGEDLKREAKIENLLGLFARLGEI